MTGQTVTEKEYHVLGKIINCEFQDGNDPIENPVWTDIVTDDSIDADLGITAKSMGGIVASLKEKGLVGSDREWDHGAGRDGSTIWVTESGYKVWVAGKPAPKPSGKADRRERFDNEESEQRSAQVEKYVTPTCRDKKTWRHVEFNAQLTQATEQHKEFRTRLEMLKLINETLTKYETKLARRGWGLRAAEFDEGDDGWWTMKVWSTDRKILSADMPLSVCSFEFFVFNPTRRKRPVRYAETEYTRRNNLGFQPIERW